MKSDSRMLNRILLLVVISFAWSHASAQRFEVLTIPAGFDTTRFGYPAQRPIERVGGIEDDLARSFPTEGAIFKKITPPRFAEWKSGLYKRTGIKLAVSYQNAFLYSTHVIQSPDVAAAGSITPEIQWNAYNRGKDYQGGIVISFLDSHVYGDAAAPGQFFNNTGSLLPHDGVYLDVPFTIINLFWEQWFKKDRFVVRVGNISAPNLIDFFRYADPRTSFQEPNLSFPASVMPFGPNGMGASFKWWPLSRSELYISAVVNDINSDISELDFGTIFETGEIFFGSEIGHVWKRTGKKGLEFDHIHLNVWYADAPSKKAFAEAALAGWGFKLAGEKQIGNWVGFANWAYNNSSGGGFGFTALAHAVNVGLAYNNPWKIKGEIAAAYTYGKALNNGDCGAKPCGGQEQADVEMYWKILVLPDLWITPGVQMLFNPSLIEGAQTPDLVWVPTVRGRVFF